MILANQESEIKKDLVFPLCQELKKLKIQYLGLSITSVYTNNKNNVFRGICQAVIRKLHL